MQIESDGMDGFQPGPTAHGSNMAVDEFLHRERCLPITSRQDENAQQGLRRPQGEETMHSNE